MVIVKLPVIMKLLCGLLFMIHNVLFVKSSLQVVAHSQPKLKILLAIIDPVERKNIEPRTDLRQ